VPDRTPFGASDKPGGSEAGDAVNVYGAIPPEAMMFVL
jgi:hypothetical protein